LLLEAEVRTEAMTPLVHKPLELPSHEVLSQLALNDTQAYEALCSQLIKDFIDSAPEKYKPRLLGLQFRVDGIRRLSSSPLGATMKVHQMMLESFLSLNQCWQDFIELNSKRIDQQVPTQDTESPPTRSAQIIEFRKRSPPNQV